MRLTAAQRGGAVDGNGHVEVVDVLEAIYNSSAALEVAEGGGVGWVVTSNARISGAKRRIAVALRNACSLGENIRAVDELHAGRMAHNSFRRILSTNAFTCSTVSSAVNIVKREVCLGDSQRLGRCGVSAIWAGIKEGESQRDKRVIRTLAQRRCPQAETAKGTVAFWRQAIVKTFPASRAKLLVSGEIGDLEVDAPTERRSDVGEAHRWWVAVVVGAETSQVGPEHCRVGERYQGCAER